MRPPVIRADDVQYQFFCHPAEWLYWDEAHSADVAVLQTGALLVAAAVRPLRDELLVWAPVRVQVVVPLEVVRERDEIPLSAEADWEQGGSLLSAEVAQALAGPRDGVDPARDVLLAAAGPVRDVLPVWAAVQPVTVVLRCEPEQHLALAAHWVHLAEIRTVHCSVGPHSEPDVHSAAHSVAAVALPIRV